MTQEEVRVVLFGNSFGSRIQLPALAWAGGNQVIGIAGRDTAKLEETARTWAIPHPTTDWRSLLELRPDLVLVSTPVDLHREMTLAALEAGAAVLCEKPFALNSAEAVEMLAAAKGRGAWLDHELRWSPHLARMRSMLLEGFVGTPWHTAIEMNLTNPHYPERPYSWWFDAARGGGMLGALGSHLLDLLRWMLGDVTEVGASLATFVTERRDAQGSPQRVTADEHAALRLRFASGTLGELATSAIVGRERSFFFQITGSAGSLRLIEGEELRSSSNNQDWETVPVDPLPSSEQLGMPEYSLFGRCLPLFFRDLLQAVRSGEPLPEGAGFEDGLAVQRILDGARASDSQGSLWVQLPRETE